MVRSKQDLHKNVFTGMRQSSVEALLGRSVALEDEESEARQDWILDTLRYGHFFLKDATLARITDLKGYIFYSDFT